MAISTSDTQSTPTTITTKPIPQLSPLEVVSVKCYSCGFSEDCTVSYISHVRDRYHGRWICGLCVEAVKDEVLRSDMLISTEEALNRHVSFCNQFRTSSCLDKTEHPISVLGRILRRSLDSPHALRSNSSSVLPDVSKISNGSSLVRSESCISALSR